MIFRIWAIARNTFREAVRDRVLYNLVLFALLMVGITPFIGRISIGIERIVLVNLGLAAITLFGVLIAIFIGIGLVAKEIEKKTLYTVLSRPVRRWEFIVGKYLGLVGTLIVNSAFMAVGLFLALLYIQHHLMRADATLLIALLFVALEFFLVTAIAILFSSFTTPTFSALFAFAIFVIGSFAGDLRAFTKLTDGAEKWIVLALSYAVPNFSTFNVAARVAHGESLPGKLIIANISYAIAYSAAALAASIFIFERRNLK